MRNIFIILSVLVSLPYAGNQMAKLKMACDIGNETACKKLRELKSNSGSNTRKVYRQAASKKIYKDPFLAKVCNMDSLSWQTLNVRDKYQLQTLRELGVTTAFETKKWICAGAYGNGAGFHYDIDKWQRNGIKTADELIAYKQAKLNDKSHNKNITLDFSSKNRSHSDSYNNIVCDRSITRKFPNILKQHSSANWMDFKNAFPRNRWKRTKFTPLEALRWRDLGFDIEDLNNLKSIGVDTPTKAKKWVCAGMNDGRAFIGIGNPFFNNVSIAYQNNISRNEAYEWYKIGLLPGQIVKWKKLGIKSAKTAKVWVDIGVVHSKQLKRWVDAGIKDPAVAKVWMQIIKVRDKEEYRNNAINGSDSMQGDYIRAILVWHQLKIYNPDEAKKWMHLKLRTNQIEKWKKNISTPEEASDWVKDGFVSGYLWKAKGFSIEEGKKWKESRIYDGYLFNPREHTIGSVLEYKKCMKNADTRLSKDLKQYGHNEKNINKIYHLYNIQVTSCKDELNK